MDCFLGTLVVEEKPEFGTILREITNTKLISKHDDLLKRQNDILEKVTGIIRSTTSVAEIQCLVRAVTSVVPTMAAIRKNTVTNIKSFVSSNSSRGNIIPQRRLFSTKKKQKGKENKSQLEKPRNSHEVNDVALSLLM